MPEFDIDSLKKSWQQQQVTPKYGSTEILSMLNRKSRNYVKYILWISIAEFALLLFLNTFYLIQNNENSNFIRVIERMGIRKTSALIDRFDSMYMWMKIISLGVTAFFVARFYQNYRSIKIEENLRRFIYRIIAFKKTVNAFIILNILLLVFFTVILISFIISQMHSQHVSMSNATFVGFVTGSIIGVLLCVLLIWLYYRLVYGIIMHRLSKNLAQLQEIENQESEE